MRTLIYKLTFMLAVLLLAEPALAQNNLPADEKAGELVSLARKYYRNQVWLDAAMTYELAMQRPENKLTEFSAYMVALSYFQADEPDKALYSFDSFLKRYPKSKYREDANYHKGLIWMSSTKTNDRERGLDIMFDLVDNAGDADLRKDAGDALRHYLFEEYDLVFLNLYLIFVKPQHKALMIEAICSHHDKEQDAFMVKDRIQSFEDEGGSLTPYLSKLKRKYESGNVMRDDRINIAVFLSFHTDLMDTATVVPKRSMRALEMYLGMQLALDSMARETGKRVNVRAFDTMGDTAVTRNLLDSLQGFDPDIIIGDLRTSTAKQISEWAEMRQVLHMIPRNPLSEIVDGKNYTFLMHPSLETHGAQTAHYLVDQEYKRKFLVFNDKSFFSNRFATAFKNACEEMEGVTVVEKIISQDYEPNRTSLPNYIKSLKTQNYDALYIPLSNEEAAGLIISQLNYHRIETKVLGGPDWAYFNVIDPEVKTAYDLRYSNFFFDQNDSTAFGELTMLSLENVGTAPSEYLVQGFDVMAYVLTLSKYMGGANPPAQVVRQAEPYHGIHIDFHFDGQQSNQEINILQYFNGRVKKVNRNNAEPGTVPNGMPGDPGRG